ncbi:hypothetical protein M899_1542 [Bacteriovorax sp. BSW11_IV]|uniref:hypothetical protein n=1 Tax=Bacteriovorax sp. BSW11_IV TaxID=1353529 RepID=UPI00038A36F9|nr:hypothetical protein [Bacteriovorax sp. BSW11_IV]EQC49420.1 hypothetical protein M899_1542 [Bacteriovorax sp. BSW11_IV]
MKYLIVLLITANSFASIDQIYSRGHGDRFPTEVSVSELAEDYLREFDESLGIQSYEEDEVTYFSNNKKGIGLIKKTNQDEPVFRNILKGIQYYRPWKNGKDLLKGMEEYTSRYGCIPKVTSVSHGWSSERPGEVHGLSGSKGYNGIYATKETRPDGLISKLGTTDVRGDLKQKIKEGSIRFCNRCLIQFYACNISTLFAKTIAEVTGCQSVVATGKAYPHFQSNETERDRMLGITGAHYWQSGAGNWGERGKVGWYRATPIDGKIIEENIGQLYIAR